MTASKRGEVMNWLSVVYEICSKQQVASNFPVRTYQIIARPSILYYHEKEQSHAESVPQYPHKNNNLHSQYLTMYFSQCLKFFIWKVTRPLPLFACLLQSSRVDFDESRKCTLREIEFYEVKRKTKWRTTASAILTSTPRPIIRTPPPTTQENPPRTSTSTTIYAAETQEPRNLSFSHNRSKIRGLNFLLESGEMLIYTSLYHHRIPSPLIPSHHPRNPQYSCYPTGTTIKASPQGDPLNFGVLTASVLGLVYAMKRQLILEL